MRRQGPQLGGSEVAWQIQRLPFYGDMEVIMSRSGWGQDPHSCWGPLASGFGFGGGGGSYGNLAKESKDI